MRFCRTDFMSSWKARSALSSSPLLFRIKGSWIEVKIWIEILLECIISLARSVFSKAAWKIAQPLRTLFCLRFFNAKNFRQSLSRNLSRGKIFAKIITCLTITSYSAATMTLWSSLLQISNCIPILFTKTTLFAKTFTSKISQSSKKAELSSISRVVPSN